MTIMRTKTDFDQLIEDALNEDASEEDLIAESLESEAVEAKEINGCIAGGCSSVSTETGILGRIVSAFTEQPCCSKRCSETWTLEQLRHHADDLSRLSKPEKKVVLLTLLRNAAINTAHTRYSETRQRVRFRFHYEPFGTMCAVAFRTLFDIRIEAFKGLLAHLKISHMSIVPPTHGNTGKGSHHTNTLVQRGVLETVVHFMEALAEAQGEFSPGRDTKFGRTCEDKQPEVLWLPACLTRSAILRMYSVHHPDFPISRTAFCTVLDTEPRLRHIKIRSPRTDMCDFCELQKRRIAATKPHNEQEAEQLAAELVAHQQAYQGERAVYNAERTQAEADRQHVLAGRLQAKECTEHISMDYGQSIDVPHTADQLGGTFYLQMRHFHLFGVCADLDNRRMFYTYDEREAGKGANEVISCLHHFLATRTIRTPHIRIHADNCGGQNKNTYVMWYLLWLAATGRVKRVEFKCMIKGHTHFSVDGGIGHLKQELRRSDVFCLEHWAAVINRAATGYEANIIDASVIYDWKTALAAYFKPLDGIRAFQHFAADAAEPGWLGVKYGFDDQDWTKRQLLKSIRSREDETFQRIPQHIATVGFKGGKREKEQALFDNLRQYVREPWKDEICPDPTHFTPPVREKKTCPDWV
jgi:hypothetical protein